MVRVLYFRENGCKLDELALIVKRDSLVPGGLYLCSRLRLLVYCISSRLLRILEHRRLSVLWLYGNPSCIAVSFFLFFADLVNAWLP